MSNELSKVSDKKNSKKFLFSWELPFNVSGVKSCGRNHLKLTFYFFRHETVFRCYRTFLFLSKNFPKLFFSTGILRSYWNVGTDCNNDFDLEKPWAFEYVGKVVTGRRFECVNWIFHFVEKTSFIIDLHSRPQNKEKWFTSTCLIWYNFCFRNS